MTTQTQGRLTPAEVKLFGSTGYLLPHQPVFAPEKFARLREIFEATAAEHGDESPLLNNPHLRDGRLLEFLLDDDLLDLVEPLVGPNIGLLFSHFISKPAGVGKATPWHEDSAYWKGRISTMEGICTVWLAIDEASIENGCMKVIPGTHVNGFSEYQKVDKSENIFETEIKPEFIDESKAVYFELAPNECSLHEARIIHGAEANTSTKRRCGYTIRFFPTSSQVSLENIPWEHRVWLARGKDLGGNSFVNA